ncbi:cerebellin-3-like [Mya arenaria]|uniref:cerebellin-3-like n=1 Tax=Mya arenaria TaxID=6604 RepID=UPI0022E3DC94|nr:cerebellin-3-like [Mya arenaria]
MKVMLPLVLILVSFTYVTIGFVVDGDANDPELLHTIIQLQSTVMALKEDVGRLKSQIDNECNSCSPFENVPAFLATLGTTVTGCSDRPVVFDQISLNEGSHYDATFGHFIAPKNGTYQFSVTISCPQHQTYHVVLVKNEHTNVIGYVHLTSQGTWTEESVTILVKLVSGDKVWLNCQPLPSVSYLQGGGYHSHFSGYFIGP